MSCGRSFVWHRKLSGTFTPSRNRPFGTTNAIFHGEFLGLCGINILRILQNFTTCVKISSRADVSFSCLFLVFLPRFLVAIKKVRNCVLS